jgi:hypothetical protein
LHKKVYLSWKKKRKYDLLGVQDLKHRTAPRRSISRLASQREYLLYFHEGGKKFPPLHGIKVGEVRFSSAPYD